MSHKRIREVENKMDISKHFAVVSKWLAIVLVPDSRKKLINNIVKDNDNVDSSVRNINQSSDIRKDASLLLGYNGKELLEDFKIINKRCYWNPCLVESIVSLEYKGFVEPCTILVTGRHTHLENLRSAWGRRVLKAPEGFVIERIGDVSGIQMEVIPQTQTMPLSDALCGIIMELNVEKCSATLEVVLERLSLWYRDSAVPSQQDTIDALGELIRERKVFHTGSGYFVVTPDTSRPQSSFNSSFHPTTAPWLPYHSVYSPSCHGGTPLLPARTHKRSISCQVTTIEESSEEEEDGKDKRAEDNGRGRKAPAVVPPVEPASACQPPGKDGEKVSKDVKGTGSATTTVGGEFKQPFDPKVKGETMKGAKAVNLKQQNGNGEKEKGEKTSLFSKIFNRKKKDKDRSKALVPLPSLPPPTAPTSLSVMTLAPSPATQEKGDKEYATFSAQFPPPEWVWYQQQVEKQKQVGTWGTQIGGTVATPAAQTTARPPKGTKSQSTNDNLQQFSRASSTNPTQADYMPMSAFSSLAGRDAELKAHNLNCGHGFVKPLPLRPEGIYKGINNTSDARYHCLNQDGNRRHLQGLPEYSVIDPSDTTSLSSSNIYQSVLTLSPVANPQDRSIYSKLSQHPPLGPYHSTPLGGGPVDRSLYRVDGHEARDRIYGPHDSYQMRKSQRSRARQNRILSYYSSQGSDISYEYKGRLPKKNSTQTKSKDSGVNCIGLGLNPHKVNKETDPVYQNATHKNPERHQSSRHQTKHPATAHYSSTHHEDEITNLNILSSLDCTTSSVACRSNATNNATNNAYNSVVYGSSTDLIGASSIMYQTTVDSRLESSEVHVLYNSLQSDFYEESRTDLASGFAAPGQIISKRFVEPLSSPETVIVDVVGSSTDVDEECESMLINVGAKKGARDAGDDQVRCPHKVGVAEVCNGSSDEASGDNCCDCDREKEVRDGGNCKPENGHSSQQVEAPTQRRQDVGSGKGNYIPDSGFSSPMNAEGTDEAATSSAQSSSASDNSSEGNDQGNNNYHLVCNDINTSPLLSASSSGDVGKESKGKSCNGECRKRFSEVPTKHKQVPSIRQGNSINSLSSDVYFQHPQQVQNLVPRIHPAAVHVHHHTAHSNCSSHQEFKLPARVPIHAEYNTRRPHRSDKPTSERSRSVNSWKSSTSSDQKQRSKKYGFHNEFHDMGVL